MSAVQRRAQTRWNKVAKYGTQTTHIRSYKYNVLCARSFHLQRCFLVLFLCALFGEHGGIPEQALVAAWPSLHPAHRNFGSAKQHQTSLLPTVKYNLTSTTHSRYKCTHFQIFHYSNAPVHLSNEEFEWSGQWQQRLLRRTQESDLHLYNRTVHGLQPERMAVWDLD